MPDLSTNRRASFDYDVQERYAAGLVLSGHEAKSAKMGRLNLAGSHVIVRGGELYLIGANIQSFQPRNAPGEFDPVRVRKILLNADEIRYLAGKLKAGLTLVPLAAYTHHGFVKLTLGLGKGRKRGDKREAAKKRETEREIRRNVR